MGSLLETSALDAQAAIALRQLHAINLSIGAERARGNVAGVAAMLPMYETWLAKLRALHAQLGATESLSTFDSFVLTTGAYIESAAQALPNAIAAVPRAVGEGLLKAAIPFAIIGAAWLYFRGKL